MTNKPALLDAFVLVRIEKPWDADRMGYAFGLEQEGVDQARDLVRALQTSAIRQFDIDDQVAFVLIGNKADRRCLKALTVMPINPRYSTTNTRLNFNTPATDRP